MAEPNYKEQNTSYIA